MIDPETGQEIVLSRPSKLGIALRRAGAWVLLAAVVVAAATYAVSALQPKTYTTTGNIFVTEGASANTQDVPTLAQLIDSEQVLNEAAGQLRMSPGTLNDDVVVTPANGLNIVQVTANAGSPQQAVAIVHAIFNAFEFVNQTLPASQQRQAYQAGVPTPTAPSEPKPKRNAGVGFVLGFLVGVGLVWFREVRRPTAADTQLVAERLGVPMFADLKSRRLERRSRSARRRALTALSLDLDELAPKGTRVLCLAGVRPGDLAPDLPIGLARAFATGGWRVILVDGDPRQQLSRKSDGTGRPGLSDLPGSSRHPAELLLDTDQPGLSLLPYGQRGLDRSQHNLSDHLYAVLDHLTADCDLVLVAVPDVSRDTAARLLAAACQGLVLVLTDTTPVATVEAAVERLSLFKPRLIGFVRDEPRGRWSLRRRDRRPARREQRPGPGAPGERGLGPAGGRHAQVNATVVGPSRPPHQPVTAPVDGLEPVPAPQGAEGSPGDEGQPADAAHAPGAGPAFEPELDRAAEAAPADAAESAKSAEDSTRVTAAWGYGPPPSSSGFDDTRTR